MIRIRRRLGDIHFLSEYLEAVDLDVLHLEAFGTAKEEPDTSGYAEDILQATVAVRHIKIHGSLGHIHVHPAGTISGHANGTRDLDDTSHVDNDG